MLLGSRTWPSSCRASQRRLTASTPGTRRGGRAWADDLERGLLRLLPRRSARTTWLGRGFLIPSCDVDDPPSARARHLLLRLRVVERVGEVRVEEMSPFTRRTSARARRCAGAPRRRRGASRRASRSSGRRRSRRRGSRRAAVSRSEQAEPETADAGGRAAQSEDHAPRGEDEEEQRGDADEALLRERVQVEAVGGLGRREAGPGRKLRPVVPSST